MNTLAKISHFGSGRLGYVKPLAGAIRADRVPTRASALAYSFFMVLPAALVFAVAALSFLPVGDLPDRIVNQLSGILPADTLELVRQTVEATLSRGSSRAVLLVTSALGALYVMNGGYSALITAVNDIYRIRETRGWLRLKLRALILSLIAALLILTAAALVMLAPAAAGLLSDHGLGAAGSALSIIRWPLVIAVVLAGIEVNFRFAPADGPRWRILSPGAMAATAAWLITTVAFGIYVNNFSSYDRIYGTLGAVIALLTWIWLSSVMFLVGAEVNAIQAAHKESESAWGNRIRTAVSTEKRDRDSASKRAP